ncbi:MAG: hypothetical protein ACI4XG_23160, partial [Bradyrhizobium sp.]
MIEIDGTVDDRDLHRGVATRRSLPQGSQTSDVGNWIHEINPGRSAANSCSRSAFHGNLQLRSERNERHIAALVLLWQVCCGRPIRRGGSKRIETMIRIGRSRRSTVRIERSIKGFSRDRSEGVMHTQACKAAPHLHANACACCDKPNTEFRWLVSVEFAAAV